MSTLMFSSAHDIVEAARRGDIDPDCLVFRVDNDNVYALLLQVPKSKATEDDWEAAETVWSSGYGPWQVLIDLLNDLGVPAESV